MIATEVQPAAPTKTKQSPPAGTLRCAADLAQAVETVNPTNTNHDVIEYFRLHPDQTCLPVTEEGTPIGLINRSIFLTGFSLPYRREVYERKSCIAFMDKTPLVVDGDLPLADLGRLAVDTGGKVLQDGFIVTWAGRFHGHGTGIDLLRALGQLEAERNQIVRESIDYAQIIQGAVLGTSRHELEAGGLTDQHLLWEPRDAVGGDAFFARRVVRDGHDGLFLALMDCTGHGVPGAFTAMLMTSFLGHALDLASPWEPGQILASVNGQVKQTLGQNHRPDDLSSFERAAGESSADEGMDVTCLWIDRADGTIRFSGARHSLWLFRPGAQEPEEIKGDRIGVGYVGTPNDQLWTDQCFTPGPGTVVLACTDGIMDQIGGPKHIAFGRHRLWAAFADPGGERPLRARLTACYQALGKWQGAQSRRDDVSMLAIKC